MCLTEWIRLRDYKGGRSRVILGTEIPAWVWEAYRVIGVFLFGCACQQLTTDVAKYTIGRLRPHFFEQKSFAPIDRHHQRHSDHLVYLFIKYDQRNEMQFTTYRVSLLKILP
ncbi:unnamed protein product [Pieris macdunnoughi]|uniref:Uncharacterized protein n=1 Tax=Pieris macdunnoughi TaxID=345717 RepID=A0A821W1I9_9NEOP|nr:unnamed protein product [Pieris macdunnoughi]